MEAANIIADSDGRFGTQEVTRLGMKEQEMKHIADLIESAVNRTEKPNRIADDVSQLVERFPNVHFCFEAESDAYAYSELAKLPTGPMTQ